MVATDSVNKLDKGLGVRTEKPQPPTAEGERCISGRRSQARALEKRVVVCRGQSKHPVALRR